MELIKSPLNYTGNKFRIMEQIQPFFPKRIKTMVDLFCGGATVSINTECLEHICIDNNQRVIGLLKFLSENKFENLKRNIFEIVEEYKLSNSYIKGFSYYKKLCNDKNANNGLKNFNKKGYYLLREQYNNIKNKNSSKANIMLYVLMLYAFNNDIRFASDGKFNLPIGKTDVNKANLNKLEKFINRTSEINCIFSCCDFRDASIKKILDKADFIYLDPPYLITDAVYNDAGQWTENDENDLINLLNTFLKQKKKFVLSNVLEKRGETNKPLYNFIKQNSKNILVKDIDYHYRSASYNKKDRNANEHEIIVVSKECL